MLRTLLLLGAALRRSWLLELAGAALVVAGVALLWGAGAGCIAGGAALLLKAMELDLAPDEGGA